LVTGDLDDPASLRAATHGMHGVFSVQPADLADPQPEAEARRGRNVADAAAAAGVAHLVYSSVSGAERRSGVAHFEVKAEIEAHIAALGLPATVLRPVFFMDNWPYLLPAAKDGERVGSLALDADTPLQMIALADIARIAADAFANPADSIGSTLEIAGDELTPRQIAEAFAAADGIPTRFDRQDPGSLPGDFAAMFAWLNEHGFRADIPALRTRYPGLLTLAAWLRTTR
jgi:uncharacterized protein YbjT (DUF2867 family)